MRLCKEDALLSVAQVLIRSFVTLMRAQEREPGADDGNQARWVDVCCCVMNSEPSCVRSVMHVSRVLNSRSNTCRA